MILALRTDKPEAEIYLLDADGIVIDKVIWQAHRELSATIHVKVKSILLANDSSYDQISGIVYYEGPGSFTGLRIGAAIVNALASSLGISAAQAGGHDWVESGSKIIAQKPQKIVIPVYGGGIHTTKPKK